MVGCGLLLAACAAEAAAWQEAILEVPYARPRQEGIVLQLLRQDAEALQRGRSVIGTPLRIGGRGFERGLGTHANGRIAIASSDPMERFSAWIGVDANDRTSGGAGSVVFSIEADGREIFRSEVLRGGSPAARVERELGGAKRIDLVVGDAGDGIACDHADWADAEIVLRGGARILADEIPAGFVPSDTPRHPFSFFVDDAPSEALLDGWRREDAPAERDRPRIRAGSTWTDPATGLRIGWRTVRFDSFPAVEWLLTVENAGDAPSPIVRDVLAIDLRLRSPLPGAVPYRLHRTKGAPSDPTDFEPRVVDLARGRSEVMGGGGGRSSNRDFPFFKIEAGDASYVFAVGWSGQWKAEVACLDGGELRIAAGLERTRFRLRPGERVRMPRILILRSEGDTREANALFRRLIAKEYAARRAGADPRPILFSNTCFTRGGGWLNETTAANQISLIRAYGPLGLEAVITDAGWFEGGWPAGAGNWTPRRDAYPDGMGPVAAAAKANGMVYGLWFEPERVVAGTSIHREHPEWLLRAPGEGRTFLLDFGRPEVRAHMLGILEGFLALEGFRVYRQDFNMDPLEYWRASDPPDRQGIAEMKCIEGLYAYWDAIAERWPDALREECAGGGRRIDLETAMRMHIHQKTDYWFDPDVDQASLWGLSQYLPNRLVVAHVDSLDEYAFHSAMASSLCVGWIADAPDFDRARAMALADRYRRVRHLLDGAWYPLLPYSRDPGAWMASQYHRPDLQEGVVLVFRRGKSPYRTVELDLRGLDPEATYALEFMGAGARIHARGSALAERFPVTLEAPRSSRVIHYERVGR